MSSLVTDQTLKVSFPDSRFCSRDHLARFGAGLQAKPLGSLLIGHTRLASHFTKQPFHIRTEENTMKRKLFVLLTIIGLFSVLLGPGMAFAQGPQPPTPKPPFPGREPDKYPSGGPWRTAEGLWYMPEGARQPVEAAGVTPRATGGPDDFGYTWDDQEPPLGVSGEALSSKEMATETFRYQLIKQAVAIWADGRGDYTLERRVENLSIENWTSTTWFYDWSCADYSNIRAWDDQGPLDISTSMSGTRIYVTVYFRRAVQVGETYHFYQAISIRCMAWPSNGNWRLYWWTTSSKPVQEYMRGVTFPSNATIQSASPPPTSQYLNYLEWRETDVPPDWTRTIDVDYTLSGIIDVSPFLQTSQPWDDDPYGRFPDSDTVNTIRRWGCAMTDAAMIINYWGARSQPVFSTNPGTLNAWLRSKNYQGYDASHNVQWQKVIEYANNNHVLLSNPPPYKLGERSSATDAILDNFLQSGNPVIMGVNKKCCDEKGRSYAGHFVVATGKTTVNGNPTYTINDPWYGKTTLYNQWNNTYFSVLLLSGTLADQRSLRVSAHSPVELLITDPQGRRLGYDPTTGTILNEIPDAEYSIQSIVANALGPEQLPVSKVIEIHVPIDGQYNLTIVGTGVGVYSINTAASNWLGQVSQQALTGTAQVGSVNSQTVNYSSYTGVNKLIYLPIIIK